MDKELTYTNEDGTKMYGFSQVSLDKNTEATNRMRETIRNSVIFLGVLLIALFWYIHHYNVLGNTISVIARCL